MDGRFPKNWSKCTRSSLFTREHITSFEVIQIIVELLEFDRTLMVVCCAVWIYPASLSITACCREVFSRADDMDDDDSTDACIMTGGEVCCCEHAENSTSLRKHLEYTSTWSVTFHALRIEWREPRVWKKLHGQDCRSICTRSRRTALFKNGVDFAKRTLTNRLLKLYNFHHRVEWRVVLFIALAKELFGTSGVNTQYPPC